MKRPIAIRNLVVAGSLLCGATAMLAPSMMRPASAQPRIHPVSVLVDGQLLQFDVSPVEIHGRVMVPLRGVFEALGATVDYDNATGNIFARRGHKQVQLTLGSDQAQINGHSQTLDVPAQAHLGRTLVPLRFVSEALDNRVDWDSNMRVVHIMTQGGSHHMMSDERHPRRH